jgi:hypothetical protein
LIKIYHIEKPHQEAITCGSEVPTYVNYYWEYPGTKTLEEVVKERSANMKESSIW